MTDRSVIVRLKADISQYQANLKRAKDATTEFGREVSGQGKTARADVESVGRSALVMGGALAIGFGKGIQVGMGFEKQMSGVRAVSGATAEEMKQLSAAALAAGASTKLAGVTASDAARAEAELVKAGVSVSDTLNGALMGSLTLAAAGQLDFADAATIAAQAMNIFDLKGGAVTHIADVLAAAANKSAADVGQLGDALRQGGLVAAQTGLSLDDTVATLAAFADNALIGSDAGTSLKTMLQRLTPVSKESAALMDEIGFSAYDAQGNFIGLQALAEELQTSMAGMTAEQRNLTMAQLFGSDAVRAANILYEQGAEGMNEYVQAVDDAGAAARMAAIQNDNLSGDIEALGGAIESALIQNGSKANDVLRAITQGATGLVNGFSSMPSAMQSTALGLGAVVTAGTLAIGVVGTLYPKVVQAQKALEGMGSGGQFLARNLKAVSGGLAAIGAGIAVVSAFEAVMGAAAERGKEWGDVMRAKALTSSDAETLDEYKQRLSEVNFQWGELTDKATSSKAPWDADYRKELRSGADALDSIGREMERVADLSDALSGAFGISGTAAKQFVLDQQAAGVDILADDFDKLKGQLSGTFREMTTGTVASHQLSAGMDTLGSDVASVEDQVKAFGETLDALFNQFFGVETAQDAFQRSLNQLPDVLKQAREDGLSLNDVLAGQSDAAIDVREQIRGMTSDASDLIAEWQEQGVTGQELQNRIDYLSASFRNQARAAGLPGPVVDHYLGLLSAIPVSKPTKITADISDAEFKLRTIKILLGEIEATAGVRADITYAGKSYRRAHGGPIYLAGGGFPGRPSGTDTVPVWATPGEFMMQKSAVDRFGVGFMEAINAGVTPPTGAWGGGGMDNSRHVSINAPITVAERRVAKDVVHGLEKIQLQAAAL